MHSKKLKNFQTVSSFVVMVLVLSSCLTTPTARAVPTWDRFKPISIEDLANAPAGYYAVSLSPETKGNIHQYADDPRDDSSTESYAFSLFTQSGRVSYIYYVPGSSPDFVQLRIRLNGSDSGTLYVRKDDSAHSPFLLHVEGITSAGELAASKAEADRKATAEQQMAQAERVKNLDTKAKALAVGYQYHGVDEDDQNGRLFNSGALEEGHAYFISKFVVPGDGTTAGVITSLLANPNFEVVQYVSQKVRGAVVGASQTAFGMAPVAVVVVGGKAPFHVPVVLGLVSGGSN